MGPGSVPRHESISVFGTYIPTYIHTHILYCQLPDGAFQEQLIKLQITIQLKLIKFKRIYNKILKIIRFRKFTKLSKSVFFLCSVIKCSLCGGCFKKSNVELLVALSVVWYRLFSFTLGSSFSCCVVFRRYGLPVQLNAGAVVFVLFFMACVSLWVGFDSRVQVTCWCTPVIELMLLRGT